MRKLRLAAGGCALALGLLIVPLIGALWWRDFAAHRRLEQESSVLRQSKEPVTFRELIQSRDQDLSKAEEFMAAARDVPPLPAIAGEFIFEDWQPDSEDELNEVYGALRPHLEQVAPKLQRMIEVARRGKITFGCDADELVPTVILLPHIDALRNVKHAFAARGNLALRENDTAELLRVVHDGLVMAGVFRDEPFTVVQLVRCSWIDSSCNWLRQLLGRGELSDSEFDTLDQELARCESELRIGNALRGERAALMTTIENIGTPQAAEFLERMAVLDDRHVTRMVGAPRWRSFLWGSLLYRPNRCAEQAFMLRRLSELADTIDLTGSEGIEKHWQLEDTTNDDLADLPICKLLFPRTEYPHPVALRCRQQLRSARLALRVARYRSREGRLPERLADAVEPEEEDLLQGLFSGGEVSYVAEESSFTLGDLLEWKNHHLDAEFTVQFQ